MKIPPKYQVTLVYEFRGGNSRLENCPQNTIMVGIFMVNRRIVLRLFLENLQVSTPENSSWLEVMDEKSPKLENFRLICQGKNSLENERRTGWKIPSMMVSMVFSYLKW